MRRSVADRAGIPRRTGTRAGRHPRPPQRRAAPPRRPAWRCASRRCAPRCSPPPAASPAPCCSPWTPTPGPRGEGTATTGHGYTISAQQAKKWTADGADARFLLVLMNQTRAIEAYSTTQRIFTEQQRLAIIARDGHCTLPGCHAPPAFCHIDHVTDWATTGRTCVDDGHLVCTFEHRNRKDHGWTVTMIDGQPALDRTRLDPATRGRTDPPAAASTAYRLRTGRAHVRKRGTQGHGGAACARDPRPGGRARRALARHDRDDVRARLDLRGGRGLRRRTPCRVRRPHRTVRRPVPLPLRPSRHAATAAAGSGDLEKRPVRRTHRFAGRDVGARRTDHRHVQ